ncbi:MAG: hypothetical protein LBV10_02280, partial [Stenotrophomonas sp.]|uniref:hypothetical protein n=1 Tax=Stenotrophomonas sp. TaxID=69392 RepID=UPI00283C6EE1
MAWIYRAASVVPGPGPPPRILPRLQDDASRNVSAWIWIVLDDPSSQFPCLKGRRLSLPAVNDP